MHLSSVKLKQKEEEEEEEKVQTNLTK